MTLVASILIDGIAYAMILFMITVGLSIALGFMHVVNMAHGAFAMRQGECHLVPTMPSVRAVTQVIVELDAEQMRA